jgi:hypothetical protein
MHDLNKSRKTLLILACQVCVSLPDFWRGEDLVKLGLRSFTKSLSRSKEYFFPGSEAVWNTFPFRELVRIVGRMNLKKASGWIWSVCILSSKGHLLNDCSSRFQRWH